jgi:hypothetical protein
VIFQPALNICKLTKDNRDVEKGLMTENTQSGSCNSMVLSLQNGNIIQFWASDGGYPDNCKEIGRATDGTVILEHRCLSEDRAEACATCSSRRGSNPQAETAPTQAV